MSVRKDWMTTTCKTIFVISGEANDIQGRLESWCNGLASQNTVPTSEHHISGYSTDQPATPRVFREREDERPSRENTKGTTQLVQRILTWTMVEMNYQYGNIWKNLTALRYTKQEPYQEEHNSAEDLLYLLKPLRSTWMKSMVSKTKKAQLLDTQQTAGNKVLPWPPEEESKWRFG